MRSSLLIGIRVGLLNGLIITKLKVNPFIATLGVGLLLKGFLNASFSNFVGSVPRSFQTFGYGEHWASTDFHSDAAGCCHWSGGFILQRTRYGAHLYGVGGNEEVARLSGLRTDRVMILRTSLCAV